MLKNVRLLYNLQRSRKTHFPLNKKTNSLPNSKLAVDLLADGSEDDGCCCSGTSSADGGVGGGFASAVRGSAIGLDRSDRRNCPLRLE